MKDHPFTTSSRVYFELLGQIQVTGKLALTGSVDLEFARLAELLLKLKKSNGQLFFIGNGGSMAIASHMSMDFTRHICRAFSLSEVSTLTAIANDSGYDCVFSSQLQRLAYPGDVLFAISSSGQSPNIIKACQVARRSKVLVITLTGKSVTNPVRALGDLNFHFPSESFAMIEVAHHFFCHQLLDYAVSANVI